MSAADEAWVAYLDGDADDGYHDAEKPAFMFAYRRALEDAADEIDRKLPRDIRRAKATDLLRARAAAVAPRETKD